MGRASLHLAVQLNMFEQLQSLSHLFHIYHLPDLASAFLDLRQCLCMKALSVLKKFYAKVALTQACLLTECC